MPPFCVTTDLKEAEKLFHKFCPTPTSTWMLWEARLVLLDHPNDMPYFLHTETSLIPLQIAVPVGMIEWFGGWLIEDQPLWIESPAVGRQLLSVVEPFTCELDQTSRIAGVTVPSRLPTYHLPKPANWDAWANSLNKKRRWEIRQADKATNSELMYSLDPNKAEELCLAGVKLSIKSWKKRGKADGSYYVEDHFIKCMVSLVRWLASRKQLQAAVRRVGKRVVGVAFGFLDINDDYVWLFGANDIQTAPSLGKALVSDIIRLACDSGKAMINACADDVGKLSVKYQMGFRPHPSWTVRGSISNWEHSDELDTRIPWIEELAELYLPNTDRDEILTLAKTDAQAAFSLLTDTVYKTEGDGK